jgi:ubiquinone biosynthesis accessory factor UbiK
MLNRNTLDELTHKITALLPDNLKLIQHDAEANIHALLQGALSRMNLVTREEFDVQTALLARTREKLDSLEKMMQKLERETIEDSDPP